MKRLLLTSALVAAFSVLSYAKDVEIPVTEVPTPVAESIMKAHPNATLVSAEKDLKADGNIEHFEIKIRDGEKLKELKVAPDGTIQKTENDD